VQLSPNTIIHLHGDRQNTEIAFMNQITKIIWMGSTYSKMFYRNQETIVLTLPGQLCGGISYAGQ
jgi:hypothetical protein